MLPVLSISSPKGERKVLLLIILVHVITLFFSSIANSAVWDESAHLAAGVAYWKKGALDIYGLSPPFLRFWMAIPALFLGAKAPDVELVASLYPSWKHWKYAELFLRENFSSFPSLIVASRLWMIPISCLGAWIVYKWARELYGGASAIAASSLYVLLPTIASRANLATTDTGTMVFMLGALWLWWQFCQNPSDKNLFLAILFISISHICKFSSLLLWPIVLAMCFWFVFNGHAKDIKKYIRGLFASVILTWFVINLAYGFHGTGYSLGYYQFISNTLNIWSSILPKWLPIPLPEVFVSGFDWQKWESTSKSAMSLFGKIYQGSVWYYYPVALFFKLPISILALGALALWSFYKSCRQKDKIQVLEAPLLIAIVIYCGIFIWIVRINIGVRYLLPVFPLALIFISRLWAREKVAFASVRVSKISCLLLCILIAEHVFIMPRYLSFYNAFAGGPANGWRIFPDSDEGQGLIDIKRWMQKNHVFKISSVYFGSVDPLVYGIQYNPIIIPCNLSNVEPIQGISEDYVIVGNPFLLGICHRMATPKGSTLFKCGIPFSKELSKEKPVALLGWSDFVYKKEDFMCAYKKWEIIRKK
jgi:hypothetical protein